MAKLTKAEAKLHAQAEALLEQDTLSREGKEFVLEHWQESANHVNSAAGAFFTPLNYALDVALEVAPGARILDLCAGIGSLAYAAQLRGDGADITCVEINPAYVDVGRKIAPEATWIEGSIFDLPDLGHFDVVLSNPPFGRVKGSGSAPRYTGSDFEFKVIDIAADLADWGVFILPAGSSPFRLSGVDHYEWAPGRKYLMFAEQTGIRLDTGIGIDSTSYPAFHGTPVRTEVCVTDFTEWEGARPVPQTKPADLLSLLDLGDAA